MYGFTFIEIIPFLFEEVTVSLSVLSDSVPESNAAMLILVYLDGEVAVDITVTVETRMGTGRHIDVLSDYEDKPTIYVACA